MKESLYIQATKKAWGFVWEHKILWVFGIFAAFLGQFGIVEFLGKVGVVSGDVSEYFGTLGTVAKELTRFVTGISISLENKMLVIFLITLMSALAAVFIFVAVVSQGAIIFGSARSIEKKKIDIVKCWYAGNANFWRLFLINFFKKILISFLAIMVGLGAYGALLVPSLTNNILFLVLFLLASVFGIIMSFLVYYTAAYVVVNKYTLHDAINAAWKLFVDHWLVSLEVGVLILVFNLFLGVASALVFVLLVFPAILLWFALLFIHATELVLAGGLIASLILFTMYLMLVGAAFTVFTTYVWTYVFMKMHKEGVVSRIKHFFASRKGRI